MLPVCALNQRQHSRAGLRADRRTIFRETPITFARSLVAVIITKRRRQQTPRARRLLFRSAAKQLRRLSDTLLTFSGLAVSHSFAMIPVSAGSAGHERGMPAP
jgi:hypothetical protein